MIPLRIFLVDDHAVVRAGLKTLINAQPDMEVIGEANDGKDAWQETVSSQPDVVVMDISMPELHGDQATAQIKRDSPQVRVLALSMHEDTSYLRELLEAGASGYVLKRSAADTLIQAIRVVAQGEVYLDPALAGHVINRFVLNPEAKSAAGAVDLSDRETDVLRLIAQGYTNKEIAAQLSISVKTVETYKARAMEKLRIDSRAAIVRYAIQRGWLEKS